MRTTKYNMVVKTFVTCEERCAIERIMRILERYAERHKDKNGYVHFCDAFFLCEDIKILSDLADLVYHDPPGEVCCDILSLEDHTHLKYLPEAEK